MSDYTPPENPYDSPQEEGLRPAERSYTWLFVLIAIVTVFVLGACACGGSLIFWARTSATPGPPIVIDVESVEDGIEEPASDGPPATDQN